jgi:hypothetical protein
MYRGFNLSLSLSKNTVDIFYEDGLQLYNEYSTIAKKSLYDFIFSDNSIDGSSLQAHWFPQVNADIFLSHSHQDSRMTIAFAGWLFETFGLKSFIDSCIWGYSNDLLKIIDNKYCLQTNGTYNYNKRNFSTSHVHMMLSSALSMMIDKTECVIFLNTPESIKPFQGIQKTESPWLYSELLTTQIVRENIPVRLRKLEESIDETDLIKSEGRAFSHIRYNAELGHLTAIDFDSLELWRDSYSKRLNPLDVLYRLYPNK